MTNYTEMQKAIKAGDHAACVRIATELLEEQEARLRLLIAEGKVLAKELHRHFAACRPGAMSAAEVGRAHKLAWDLANKASEIRSATIFVTGARERVMAAERWREEDDERARKQAAK